MPAASPSAPPTTVPVTVPGGFPRDRRWTRTLHLRPWNGLEEIDLTSDGPRVSAAARATRLLAHCVHHTDDRPVGTDFARELTLGDREALLLHLRRLSVGPRVPSVLACPECDEKLDVGLETEQLLTEPYDREGERHDLTVEVDDRPVRVEFRLPNGGDQEAVAPLARTHPERAAARLADRCVLGVRRSGEDEPGSSAGTSPSPPPPAVIDPLARRMAELDPQAEILVSMECPACGTGWNALFDAFRYLAAEVERARERLDRETHLLAYHYGWSEAEILGLPAPRRRRHARYLADRLGASRSA